MKDKPRFDIKVSESFKATVAAKALELFTVGKDEGYVDERHFGKLALFIDRKPEMGWLLFKGIELSPELQGKTIYIGGSIENQEEEKSS